MKLRLERKKHLIEYTLLQSSSARGRLAALVVQEALGYGTSVYHRNGRNELGPEVGFQSETSLIAFKFSSFK